MSLLVVKLPPRERLGARAPGTEPAPALRLPAQWEHVFSADGRQAGPLRQAAAAQLPKADSVVLVLALSDVSWHHVLVPKAAPARMAAALAGVLEERLLDDESTVHLALAPDAVPGREGWVAATHGPRLAAALAALEAAGHVVERVATLLPPPGLGLRGHFALQGDTQAAGLVAASQAAGLVAASQAAGLVAASQAAGLVAAPEGAGVAGQATATATATATAPTWAEGGEPCLSLSREDGVWSLPLAGPASTGLAAALRLTWADDTPNQRWTTTPAAALAAERYLGRPVPLQTEAEHLLEAATGAPGAPAAQAVLNLRQFALASQHRGLRAVGAVGKRLLSADWRLARYGLVALLALQLLGLNAYAWQQRQALQARRAAINEVLRTTHPGVRTVLDAPVQMAAETERLRAAAGRAGGADLEVVLGAAAAAWPDGKGPVGNFRYESGRLVLAAPGWQAAEVAAMRDRLRPAGWAVEWAEGRLTLARARTGAEAAVARTPGAAL